MSERVYLLAGYDERLAVKALGALFDGPRKKWFVPPGKDLAPFEPWLPEDLRIEVREAVTATAVDVVRGVSLTQLMGRVGQAVVNAFRDSEWVRVEVSSVSARGHIYLELAERDGEGKVLAQARGVIWSSTAERILPKFQEATGVVLGPNLKLLVSARPSLHPAFGLSLQIDDIDPQYTLGDLEARRREIRQRLQAEGVFDRNRQLPAPWDFRSVLVLAPESAAGLGDFMAEARRLERFGVCSFEIVNSRFQGDGAPAEMREALLQALAARQQSPDAVVIIRGGGAVNDLAWLDEYLLARCICELDVPVLTGIGHERDRTILDEVAHSRYDTPSKVIAGIEGTITQRTREARQAFQAIHAAASQAAAVWRQKIREHDATVRQQAVRQLARARSATRDDYEDVRTLARTSVLEARDEIGAHFGTIRRHALEQIAEARQQVPQWMAEVRAESRQALRTARQQSDAALATVEDRTRSAVQRENEKVEQALRDVAQRSRQTLADARDRSQALVREIVGQGPEKTLKRGFAVVRDDHGATITNAAALRDAGTMQVQFSDGSVPARVRNDAPDR